VRQGTSGDTFYIISEGQVRVTQKVEGKQLRLGSVAGPVIQATGRSEFEDGLGSGDFVSGYSYHMSVRTRLSDHTKQTKLQSQQPSDVKNTCSL
jgi:CRP-like cAMP-binding protein